MRMHSRYTPGRDRLSRLLVFCALAIGATALLLVPSASAGGRAAPVLGWVPQTPFSSQILYACAVTGTADAWAVGNNGIMLHSVDSGATWTSVDAPGITGVGDYFHAIAFDAPSQGWAVSQYWGIICIQNGVPVKQTSPAQVALEDVAAVSYNHAWIVGGSGTILVTTDGGTTWTQQTTPANTAPLSGVAFADLTHGWAVGFKGTILATVDGGVTWTAQTSPDSGTSINIERVACADTLHVWAADVEGNIFATTDGGATWKQQFRNNGGLLDLTCLDGKHVWASGTGGTIAATMDGVTWTSQDSRASNSLFGIAFWSATHGVAVGLQGTVVTTTSGGWGDLIKPVTKAINAVSVKKGKTATMRYEVLDATPGGDTEWVTIVVKTAKGKVVKTWQVGSKAPNKILSCKYKVTFKKGAYKWYVYAEDSAENVQSKMGSNKFIVK